MAKTKRKKKKSMRQTKRTKHLPKIFVINLKKDKDKWDKYKEDDRYMRYSACNGLEMSQENPYFDKLQIMWNASDRKKKCTAGILNSHISIIKKIVKQKLNQTLILEDDAIVDFKTLHKLNLNKLPQDSITYFGGTLHPPDTFNNKTWKHDTIIKSFKKGINRIDPDKYRILGGHGYYFPTWKIAKELLDILNKKKKIRALDTEMVYLQRKGIIKYFYYPAISYLLMEDAKKGVHAEHILRDMKQYGGAVDKLPVIVGDGWDSSEIEIQEREINRLTNELRSCQRVVDRITKLYEIEKLKQIHGHIVPTNLSLEWEEHRTSDGKKYYWNNQTCETTYIHPRAILTNPRSL